ncbi:MAG: GH3 auxin-responsive promoter family protein [Tannerellaceae bacterium]|jgi:hypothetical protein|nr:GH3 auxin-responsive promoter family protein [Tannerellaceae bacterium]
MDRLTATIFRLMRPRLNKIDGFATNGGRVQREQLKYLVTSAKHTYIGELYDFGSIRRYEDFAERIMLQTYENLRRGIFTMINGSDNVLWPSKVKWYAQSSGTTNDKSKYIPITQEILRAHYKGGFDTVALYLRNNPHSSFFSHKGLILGGCHRPSLMQTRSHCGDLSGILIQKINPLVNLLRVPSKKISLMNEWEAKIKALVENTRGEDVGNISGVPSWMLVLIKAMLEKTGCGNLSEVWPNLEVFFHGGIGFEPYRDQYKSLIPVERMRYMETYNASEGFFGIQDDPSDASMLLMPDYGIFYEFVPAADVHKSGADVFTWDTVEKGRNYAIVITTAGGLWRYVIGDTIRFTSLHPHKFVISGRTTHYINAFGEELIVDNADNAISAACRMTGAKVKEYTAAPLFMLDKAQGMHEWLIEFEKIPESVARFADELDRCLKEHNSDYEAKRYKDLALRAPKVIVAPKDIFSDWLKGKGKLGGQHKVPRLSNDRRIIDELLSIMQQRGA